MAYQAYKVSISFNSSHAESFNNLGVLELRKTNVEQSKNNFMQSQKSANYLFEPIFNLAYLHYKRGEFQQSFTMVHEALRLFPEHADSKELLKYLQRHFAIM